MHTYVRPLGLTTQASKASHTECSETCSERNDEAGDCKLHIPHTKVHTQHRLSPTHNTDQIPHIIQTKARKEHKLSLVQTRASTQHRLGLAHSTGYKEIQDESSC